MKTESIECGPVVVDLIPSRDNYLYLVRWGNEALVVDPAEADPVETALAATGARLTHILATHHHADHVAGIPDLKSRTGAAAVGPTGSGIRGVDRGVGDGDCLDIGPLSFRVLATPGHTEDHLSYHEESLALLWCGDVLFGGGCGRLFECGPEVMWGSLQRLAALPDATRVFCGHEYTVKNLEFGCSLLSGDSAMRTRLAEARDRRRAGRATLPSTIGLEKSTNLFLRSGEPAVAEAAGIPGAPAVEVFAALRRRRDRF